MFMRRSTTHESQAVNWLPGPHVQFRGEVALEVGGLSREQNIGEDEMTLLFLHDRYVLREGWCVGSCDSLAYVLPDVVISPDSYADILHSAKVCGNADPRSYEELQLRRCSAVTL